MRFVFSLLIVAFGAVPLFAGERQPVSGERTFRAITANDRVLVLSPHPDDESLGAGGLIQRAVGAHAKVRVVFATDGEANPWAQRFVEHRAVISESDRARWGARRKQEAIRAVATLGVPAKDVIFLDLPDQGVTPALMSGDKAALAKFRAALADFHPTIAAFTSRYDVHPDHNACFVFAHLVLGPPSPRLTELEFIVHKKPLVDSRGEVVLNLTPAEVDKKRDAISCHTSQTALSGKSLRAFAKPQEIFYEFGAARVIDKNSPIREASVQKGRLLLKFADANAEHHYRKAPLLVAGEGLRRTYTDAFNDQTRTQGEEFAIPLKASHPYSPIFLKLNSRGLFLDNAGWREVPAR